MAINETDLKEGTEIAYSPHGVGEIVSIEDNMVTMYFHTSDLAIKILVTAALTGSRLTLAAPEDDIPNMLQTLISLEQETWEITKRDIMGLAKQAETNIPLPLARILVRLWSGTTNDVQVRILKEKVETVVVSKVAEHLRMFLLSQNGYLETPEQVQQRVENYRMLRNNPLTSERAVMT